MRIGIIGAGLAGIEAAVAARKAGMQNAVIYSLEAYLPYMRPRLPEIAFGSGDISKIVMHPKEWYDERDITLRLDTPVTSVDVGERVITTPDGDDMFDAIVFASGSKAARPIIKGADSSHSIYTLWTAFDAVRLHKAASRASSMAIVGGGILGIECALRAAKSGIKVTLIEKAPHIMPLQLDSVAAQAVCANLKDYDITVCEGSAIESAEQIGSKLCIRLEGQKKSIDVDIMLLAIGARSTVALAKTAGLTVDRGICVDETLQTSCPLVYAAGDCVQYGAMTRCSARSAMLQGRVAGINAAAAVKGTPPVLCPSDIPPLHFKSRDLEIHSWGQTAENCMSAEALRLDKKKNAKSVRLEVKRSDGVRVGLQMVGTDEGFDELVKKN